MKRPMKNNIRNNCLVQVGQNWSYYPTCTVDNFDQSIYMKPIADLQLLTLLSRIANR